MDTNIFIWVTDIIEDENGSILDGIAFDGDLGFGNDDIRNYHGNLAMYSVDDKSVINSDLSIMHIARKGMVWLINSKKLPSPPFLLCNKLNLVGPFEKLVDAKLTSGAEQSLESGGYGEYPIYTEEVIGLLNYQDSYYSIIMFSESKESLTKLYFEPYLSEWDMKLGKLTVK